MFTNFVYFIIIENHVPIHLFYQLKLCQDNFSGNILFKTKINEMSYILIDQGQKHVAGMSERHINQNTRRTHLLNLQPVFVIFLCRHYICITSSFCFHRKPRDGRDWCSLNFMLFKFAWNSFFKMRNENVSLSILFTCPLI